MSIQPIKGCPPHRQLWRTADKHHGLLYHFSLFWSTNKWFLTVRIVLSRWKIVFSMTNPAILRGGMEATILPPSEITFFLLWGWVFLFPNLQPACTRLLWWWPNSGLHAASTDWREEQKGKTGEGKEGSGSTGVGEVGLKETNLLWSLLFPSLWPALITLWPQAWKGTAQAMPLQGGSAYPHLGTH